MSYKLDKDHNLSQNLEDIENMETTESINGNNTND